MVPNPEIWDEINKIGETDRANLKSNFTGNQIKIKNKKENASLALFSKLFFWGENKNLDQALRKFEAKMPSVASFLATVAMFIIGITARGEWALFAVYFFKYLQTGGNDGYVEETHEMIDSMQSWFNIRFKDYFSVFIPSVIVGYVLYFGLGGFLHWYYYVRQRETPETWKCQPTRWITPELERHEIMLGSTCLVIGSAISAAFCTYVMNDGELSRVYFNSADYGYIWLILQVPVVFIYQDYITYWTHRIYHTPWLYKKFHKLHHIYKTPTAFSVTAIHPVEFTQLQFQYISATLIFPVHWINFAAIMMYTYYHGILDHSGIAFKRHWWQPWQPNAIFHDNHHQYFHVNYGFNIDLWDRIHGTYRQMDRIYSEKMHYAGGKAMSEATAEELQTEIMERESENPLAHSVQGSTDTKDILLTLESKKVN